jgi:hypothetical protein
MDSRHDSAGRRFPFREFVGIPLAILVYAVVLHWVYSELVTGLFYYLGYRYSEPTPQIAVIAYIIAVVTALALPRKMGKPSAAVLWILYAVTAAPGILIAPYTGYLDDGEAITLSLVIGAVFSGVALKSRGTPKPLRMNVSPTSFWLVLGVFSITTYGLLAFTQGLSLRYISFDDVYDVRSEYDDQLEGIGILSYLVFTQANVVNPVIIARGIFAKRFLPVFLGILGQLVIFSGTGFKSILFSIPAVLIIAAMFYRKSAPDGVKFVWGGAALMLLAASADAIQGSNVFTSLFSRRFLITPGVFSSVYVGFFKDHPQTQLGHSVLRWWVEYPYDMTPPYVIGQWMANLPTMAANANLFADGYANFGWAGVIGAGVVLLVYVKFLDRVSIGLPVGVVAMVMTMPAVALSSTSILTSMLSHGLVVAVFLLAIAPRDGWEKKPKAGPRERKRSNRSTLSPTGTRSFAAPRKGVG